MVEKGGSSRSSSSSAFWLFLGALLLLNLFIWVRIGLKRGEDSLPQETLNGFSLSEPPKMESGLASLPPASPDLPKDRLFRPDGPGLRGFVPEARPKGANPAAGRSSVPETSQREKEVLAKYDGAFKEYQLRMKPMVMRYRERYPVVRQFARDLDARPRYLALEQQYRRDRDAYKWARSVVQLPEMREMVWKYAKNSEAWKVGILMTLDVLRQPPMQPIYDEAKRLATSDPLIQEFFTEFWSNVVQNIGQMSVQVLPAGTDMTPIYNLIRDLTPASAGSGLQQGATEQQQQFYSGVRSAVTNAQKRIAR